MKKDFVEGAKAATPIILGYIPVGIAYGMLAKATGLTFFKALIFPCLCIQELDKWLLSQC